jgi:hypothetical protein
MPNQPREASTRREQQAPREIAYDTACKLLERVLSGTTRGEILDAALVTGSFGKALAHLRVAMRTHTFPTASAPLALTRLVETFDSRCQAEGFHVLQSWDFRAHRFADDTAPVLMLDYCARAGISASNERSALAVMLDQYFLAVVSLLAMRAWDDGDPNANLDRVSRLIQGINGPTGSGQQFVDDAEMLVLLAISHYHPAEAAYEILLNKVRTLDAQHRLRLALACSATLGGHLRWGFHFMYRRDVGLMREDNVVDYPWLLFSLATLMQEYGRMHDENVRGVERERVVEGLLNGLTPDPWAFVGKAPGLLREHHLEHDELRQRLDRYRADLLTELEEHRPLTTAYSPIALECNFLSNMIVAMVALAVGGTPPEPLGALLTPGLTEASAAGSLERYARTLMAWSGTEAATQDSDGKTLIVYDPRDALRSFNTVVRTLGDRSE